MSERTQSHERSLTALPRTRLLLAYGVIAIIFTGSMYDIINDRDHWPFSAYPMFSVIPTREPVRLLRLFGVSEEPDGHEVPLVATEYLAPFDDLRLQGRLALLTAPDSRQQLDEALSNCLARYQARLREHRIDGPSLRGIRLYQLEWQFQPHAANRERPDSRELIAEVLIRRQE